MNELLKRYVVLKTLKKHQSVGFCDPETSSGRRKKEIHVVLESQLLLFSSLGENYKGGCRLRRIQHRKNIRILNKMEIL